MGKYEHAIMVAVLLYVQWTKAQHRAKLSKWMLKLNEKGNAATIVEDKKKITSSNCDCGRSHVSAVDNLKVNIQMCKYGCDHGRSVTLCSVE